VINILYLTKNFNYLHLLELEDCTQIITITIFILIIYFYIQTLIKDDINLSYI
jgi:hypothetical protein